MSATSASAEEAAAQAAAAAAIAVRDILTPIVVATMMSCALLGVLLALVAQYFSAFSNDRLPFRLLVGAITVLALWDTSNQCAWAYRYAVQNYGNPAQLAEWPTQFSVFAFSTATSIYVCQLFFVWRSWVVGGRTLVNNVLTAFQALMATAAAGCVYAMAILSVKDHWILLSDFNPLMKNIWSCASLLWHLVFRPRKIGKDVISSPLTRIAVLAVKTNALSLIVQVTTLILTIVLPTMHYALPGFLEVKTYCVCVVATLNARNSANLSATSFDPSSASAPRQKGLGAFDRSQQVTVHTTVQRDVEEDSQYRGKDGLSLGYEPSVPHNPYTVFVLDEGAVRELDGVSKGGKGTQETEPF
ncbi:hypothetical protein JCM11251_004703 [Rhodosporidiobolus azoricus]